MAKLQKDLKKILGRTCSVRALHASGIDVNVAMLRRMLLSLLGFCELPAIQGLYTEALSHWRYNGITTFWGMPNINAVSKLRSVVVVMNYTVQYETTADSGAERHVAC